MSFALTQELNSIKRSCILCGRCTAACPSCQHGGVDPMEIMAGGEDALDQCIMCGTCSRVCFRSNPFRVVRGMIYIEQGLGVSDVFKETGFTRAPLEDRCIEPVWDGDDVYVMTGCVVEGVVPYVEYAGSKAMEIVGTKASKLPNGSCCLRPIQFMEIPLLEKRNRIKEMCASANGKPIVTLCAGCAEEIEPVDPSVVHIIKFLHEHLDDLPAFDRPVKVGMEPGCSAAALKKELKAILQKMNCVVVNNDFGCCGKNAPLAPTLMEERMEECAGAEIIVVGCPMCLSKYDGLENGIPTVHIAELVAMAAGDKSTLGFHRIPVEL